MEIRPTRHKNLRAEDAVARPPPREKTEDRTVVYREAKKGEASGDPGRHGRAARKVPGISLGSDIRRSSPCNRREAGWPENPGRAMARDALITGRSMNSSSMRQILGFGGHPILPHRETGTSPAPSNVPSEGRFPDHRGRGKGQEEKARGKRGSQNQSRNPIAGTLPKDMHSTHETLQAARRDKWAVVSCFGWWAFRSPSFCLSCCSGISNLNIRSVGFFLNPS